MFHPDSARLVSTRALVPEPKTLGLAARCRPKTFITPVIDVLSQSVRIVVCRSAEPPDHFVCIYPEKSNPAPLQKP